VMSSLTRKHLLGFRQERKLLPCSIPTVGIVQNKPSTPPQQSHKHHHHGGAICPYGYSRSDAGNLFQWGRARALRLCLYKSIKKLSPQLPMFSMIHLPTVENGCKNGPSIVDSGRSNNNIMFTTTMNNNI
jgi:hypothetical protein